MKSTRRHELQHNVLDAELAKLVDFFRKWGTHLAWGLLAVVLIAGVILYVHSKHKQKSRWLQGEYDRLVVNVDPNMKPDVRLEGLSALADQDDNARIAAMACVEIGDEYARQLLMGTGELEAGKKSLSATRSKRRNLESSSNAPSPESSPQEPQSRTTNSIVRLLDCTIFYTKQSFLRSPRRSRQRLNNIPVNRPG